MAPFIYLAHPRGAHRGEWRGVVNGFPDGFKIHYFACCLAEMAVEAGCGGLLRHGVGGAGAPMEPEFIATALGADYGWARTVLFPALQHIGEGNWDQNGGWICTSPMASRTLSWQAGDTRGQKALPPGRGRGKTGRPAIFTGVDPGAPEFSGIYKKWQRTCYLPQGVRLAGVCPKFQKGPAGCLILSGNVAECPNKCPEMSENPFRTNETEYAEIVDEIKCPEIDNKRSKAKEIKKAAACENRTRAAAPLAKTKNIENLPSEIEGAISILPAEVQANCRNRAAKLMRKGLPAAAVVLTLTRVSRGLKTAKDALKIINFMFSSEIEAEICTELEEAENKGQRDEAQREAKARRQGEETEKLAAKINRNRLEVQKRMLSLTDSEQNQLKEMAESRIKITSGLISLPVMQQTIVAEMMGIEIL